MNLRLLSIAVFLLPLAAVAEIEERSKDQLLQLGTPEQIGEEIAIEFDNRDLGFVSQIAQIKLVLHNAHGDQTSREMEARTYERPARDIGDMSMLLFHSPPDISGTTLLSHAKILKPDDQWLYLPSIKRVKRISSKNKSGPFVGSEFAYEDITGNEVGKYTWRYESLEPCPVDNSLECYKLSSTPRYEHSGYTKRLAWIDTDELRLYQLEFYDRKGEKLKTQTNHGYKEYIGRYWRADVWKMENHQTGKSTEVVFKNYEFKTGLSEKDFNKASLKRIR